MIFNIENRPFSIIILTIPQKRSKRLTFFCEIAAFPFEKVQKSLGERLKRKGWKRQTLQLFSSKYAALLKLAPTPSESTNPTVVQLKVRCAERVEKTNPTIVQLKLRCFKQASTPSERQTLQLFTSGMDRGQGWDWGGWEALQRRRETHRSLKRHTHPKRSKSAQRPL